MDIKTTMLFDRKAFQVLTREGEFANRLPRTRFDYAKNVGDGLSSPIIVATAMWVARQFPEAPLAIRDEDGELDFQHPLVQLFQRPNPWYGEGSMRMAIALDYTINGNAYLWTDPRGADNRPEGLIWIPSFMMTPKGTKTELVTHYEYHVYDGGRPKEIDLQDITHFRNGIDPKNQRLGLAPLHSLVREVFTDDEAANFTASVLRNMGYPGLIISPGSEADEIGPRTRGRIKKYFRRMFRGDQRGEVLVTTGQLKIDKLDVDLSKLNIDKLRQIPEERVTAVIGVPAAVVGFGTGLEQTKVGATLSELRELAYENVVIPMQRVFAEEIENRLLPEFEPDPDQFSVIFDNSQVRVLQEDENKISERIRGEYRDGIITRAEARRETGREAGPADEVYRTGLADTFIPASGGTKSRKLMLKSPTDDRKELIRRFQTDVDRLSGIWADELIKAFDQIAEDISRIWLVEQVLVASISGNGGQRKQLEEPDRALVDRILLAFQVEAPSFEKQYLRVAKATAATVENVIGLGVMLDDPMELRIITIGGTRKGLVDMTEQTREAMYDVLSAAREEGLGPAATARKLRDGISAGPWKDVQTRAMVIARTETKHAQNVSSLEVYSKAENVSRIQVFDAQKGDTDADCEAMNGRIVTIAEAQSIPPLDHPNCTRSFAPIVD